MLRKISLLTLAFCSQTLANSFDYGSGHSSNTMQFYAGLSGGFERMAGRRTDSVTEDDLAGGIGQLQTIFSNKGMSENNAVTSLIGGFLWGFPQSTILIGPEIYFGRGNTASAVQDDRLDLTPAFRHYSTTLQRKNSYGLILRAGYQFNENYLGYLSAGYDKGQFATDRVITYAPRNVTATRAKKTKWLNGLSLGMGIEKKCGSFVVGVDLRMIKYSTFRVTDALNIAPGINPGFIDFSASPKIYSGNLRISYQF